jgi:hypothetical protein
MSFSMNFSPYWPSQVHPVLIDIGASGQPPAVWASLAAQSIYIGFDPDLRETQQPQNSLYYQAKIIHQAITNNPQQSEVQFYLTHSPFCSSTLLPNQAVLGDYLHAHLFAVEGQSRAESTTLDAVLDGLGLTRVHWLKLDSQGTDLRLFQSLTSPRQAGVLALDIEPGLLAAYEGEDTFPTAHQALTQAGFWLSDLNVQGTVRGRASTLQQHLGFEPEQLKWYQHALKTSPGWCEARYLRSIAWMDQHDLAWEDYSLLAIFACLDGQWAFALDVTSAQAARFGRSNPLQTEVIRLIRQQLDHANRPPSLIRRIYRKLRQLSPL